MKALFLDNDGVEYNEDDVYKSLLAVGADDCETLFLHSDVMLGIPAGGFRRSEYIGTLYNAIDKLGVKNLIVPTFTYSFCNGENYDVLNSPTSMGALNEFIRKLPDRYRTLDPLLSLSVPNNLKSYFDLNIDKVCRGGYSLGKDSGLDKLHKMSGVKFLFLGARLYDCFTYLHYVECMRDVPYRFNMPFTGKIIDENGKSFETTQYIHTACTGVSLREDERFENYLTKQGFLKKVRLGNSFVSAISEEDAYREINEVLSRDIYYFLNEPPIKMEHKYTYDSSKGRITHC